MHLALMVRKLLMLILLWLDHIMLYLLLISLLHSSCCFKKKCSINGGTSSYCCLACDACSHSYGHFSNAPVWSLPHPGWKQSKSADMEGLIYIRINYTAFLGLVRVVAYFNLFERVISKDYSVWAANSLCTCMIASIIWTPIMWRMKEARTVCSIDVPTL